MQDPSIEHQSLNAAKTVEDQVGDRHTQRPGPQHPPLEGEISDQPTQLELPPRLARCIDLLGRWAAQRILHGSSRS